jgi:hypothetical protein
MTNPNDLAIAMTAAERKPKSVSQIYVEALCYGKGL